MRHWIILFDAQDEFGWTQLIMPWSLQSPWFLCALASVIYWTTYNMSQQTTLLWLILCPGVTNKTPVATRNEKLFNDDYTAFYIGL
jgi:hypothetical protein